MKLKFKNNFQLAGFLVVSGLLIFCLVGWITGSFDFTGSTKQPVNSPVAVVPPPQKQTVENVVVNTKTIETDSEMLTLSRDIRLAALKKKKAEMEQVKEQPAQVTQQGNPFFATPPATPPTASIPSNPLGESDGGGAGSIKIKMIVHGLDPVAWIEKGGETIPVRLGQKAFGHVVSSIKEDEVCFKGYRCVALSL